MTFLYYAKRSFSILFTAAFLASCAESFAQGTKGRTDFPISRLQQTQVVDTLIRKLNENYVFPETAKKIEVDLIGRLSRGEFNEINSTREFAAAVTRHIRAIAKDKHLVVGVSAQLLPDVPHSSEPDRDQLSEIMKEAKYDNYGIQKVERLPGNIGYLDLREFALADFAGPSIAAAMTLVSGTDALIIDLRENGGGAPSAVALLASYFFDGRTHLTDLYSRKTGLTEQFWTSEYVPGVKYGKSKPVYVLTSRRTFSGAEAFSYDLKILKRATIVGETTAGGANPGEIYRLADHVRTFIPSGYAINPSTKTNWEGIGVDPDVAVDQARALDTAQMLALKRLSVEDIPARRKAEVVKRMDELGKQQ